MRALMSLLRLLLIHYSTPAPSSVSKSEGENGANCVDLIVQLKTDEENGGKTRHPRVANTHYQPPSSHCRPLTSSFAPSSASWAQKPPEDHLPLSWSLIAIWLAIKKSPSSDNLLFELAIAILINWQEAIIEKNTLMNLLQETFDKGKQRLVENRNCHPPVFSLEWQVAKKKIDSAILTDLFLCFYHFNCHII